MLAQDLAEMLMEHPDWKVSVSVDISKGEDDWQLRAFGEIVEVMNDNGSFVILCTGQTNEDLLYINGARGAR